MELKQLRSFAAVVRYGSFTEASERLHLSQPSVSAHVRALEEHLGRRLILRTTKRLEVTPLGQEVFRRAEDILELERQMEALCAQDGKRIIRLGASTIPSAYVLPQLLPEFGRAHPEVYFTVQQTNSQGVADGLMDGLFDVGLMGMKPDGQLGCIPFCQDRMVLIAPVSDPCRALHGRQPVPLEELLRLPIILREKSSGSQKTADRFLEAMGIQEEQLHVVARINDQEAIKNLVAGGLGISFISERAARNFVEEKRVLQFDLPVQGKRSLYLAWRQGYILPPHVRAFLSFARRSYPPESRRTAPEWEAAGPESHTGQATVLKSL